MQEKFFVQSINILHKILHEKLFCLERSSKFPIKAIQFDDTMAI